MPGSPDQNGIAKKRNRTLKDMSVDFLGFNSNHFYFKVNKHVI